MTHPEYRRYAFTAPGHRSYSATGQTEHEAREKIAILFDDTLGRPLTLESVRDHYTCPDHYVSVPFGAYCPDCAREWTR